MYVANMSIIKYSHPSVFKGDGSQDMIQSPPSSDQNPQKLKFLIQNGCLNRLPVPEVSP